MLKIHELTSDTGELTAVYLRIQADSQGGLELVEVDGAWPLPAQALERVLARYGAPFDPEAPITEVAALDLSNGQRLRQVRHLAGYDVVPRDYLILEGATAEPLCAMGAAILAPLRHLARVMAGRT